MTAKLTPDEQRELARMHADPSIPINTIRKKFKISQKRIEDISYANGNTPENTKRKCGGHRRKIYTPDQLLLAAFRRSGSYAKAGESLGENKTLTRGAVMSRIKKMIPESEIREIIVRARRPKKTKVRRVAPARIPAEVLRLKHEEEYTHGEIAETLMISVDRVVGILWARHPENPRRLDFVFPGGVEGMEVRA